MTEGIGESEMEELVPEWSWRRDKGSCIQNLATLRSTKDMIAGVKTETGSCDPDHTPYRSGLSFR